jgi:diadenosine tetraphosphate (Ap4A) HIT family hydrolase
VQALFDPVKLNYLTLGNTVPHLHTHVLPRYRDDPAPGGPIAWEQIFSPEPASICAQLPACRSAVRTAPSMRSVR